EDLPAWSPDGRLIAFTRASEKAFDPDGRSEIDVIEPRPGAAPRRLAHPYAPNNQLLTWSPDSKLVAYLEGREPRLNAYMQDRLSVVPAAGGAPRSLSEKLDRAVMSYAFNGNASITIAVEDDRSVYPAIVDVSSAAIERTGGAGEFTVSALS